MSPSASSPGWSGNSVVVGVPGSRRVELWQAALSRFGLPPSRVVAHSDLLAGRVALCECVEHGDAVRIESPGKDWELERALLLAGAEQPDDGAAERLERATLMAMEFERGRILAVRQWFLGWRALLETIAAQLAECPPHRLMLRPADIAVMFDKRACHARMERAGIAVPPSLGPVDSFDELLEQMRERGWGRVFVKLAHGSSASGAVALAVGRSRAQAVSTVEMIHDRDGVRLYNSRRLKTYRDTGEIVALIDAVCRHRVHVERWLPKAGIAERTFDLRVVVIAGRARHVVARLSRGPMTNLHLLNARGDALAVAARMGAQAWELALESCERAMAVFPHSMYGGIDLLIAPGFRRHAVLEANAFGDLLPGVLSDTQDTYTAEAVALGPGVAALTA